MQTLTYKDHFPHRTPINVEIPAGFVDDSWRDDVCPKFINLDMGLLLWVEEPDPAKRETPDWPRYRLERVKRSPDVYDFLDEVVVESENYDDVLKAIDAERKA